MIEDGLAMKREAMRRGLMEGSVDLPRKGRVVQTDKADLPFAVVDKAGAEVPPVSQFLEDVSLSDQSRLTGRSYAYDLLRWFRVLWALRVPWDRATSADTAALVGYLRNSSNPQRQRHRSASPEPGTVNPNTGKPYPGHGYSARTINHNLSVVSEFYKYHAYFGIGPVINPVPDSPDRRNGLQINSSEASAAHFSRGRLRQRETRRLPTVLSDQQWRELLESMTCDRDRALMLFYWTSGARASEILGLKMGDVDWASGCVYVISKGSRARQAVPVSAEALRCLMLYLDESGVREFPDSLWLTRRGASKPLSYWAFRRIFQRANEALGMNWTLHDLRHTASTRMANDESLTLPEVQTILRHANITTTGEYLCVRVEDLVDKMQAHYERPRVQRRLAPGYAPEDMKAVFGDGD